MCEFYNWIERNGTEQTRAWTHSSLSIYQDSSYHISSIIFKQFFHNLTRERKINKNTWSCPMAEWRCKEAIFFSLNHYTIQMRLVCYWILYLVSFTFVYLLQNRSTKVNEEVYFSKFYICSSKVNKLTNRHMILIFSLTFFLAIYIICCNSIKQTNSFFFRIHKPLQYTFHFSLSVNSLEITTQTCYYHTSNVHRKYL